MQWGRPVVAANLYIGASFHQDRDCVDPSKLSGGVERREAPRSSSAAVHARIHVRPLLDELPHELVVTPERGYVERVAPRQSLFGVRVRSGSEQELEGFSVSSFHREVEWPRPCSKGTQ